MRVREQIECLKHHQDGVWRFLPGQNLQLRAAICSTVRQCEQEMQTCGLPNGTADGEVEAMATNIWVCWRLEEFLNGEVHPPMEYVIHQDQVSPSSMSSVTYCSVKRGLVKQERWGTKPCWVSGMAAVRIKWCIIEVFRIDSMILQTIDVRLTGQ